MGMGARSIFDIGPGIITTNVIMHHGRLEKYVILLNHEAKQTYLKLLYAISCTLHVH